MAEIANAWISIVPDTSKIAPGIKKALGEADSGVASAGKSMGTKLSGAMGTALKASAAGIGVAAGGIIAGSVAKGMGRLSAIEGAKAKLAGLGSSAEQVAGIVDNALASVKGTANGLGEAATTSAMLVAAGVEQGKELETTLKTVGDVAAISGRSMADVGTIFGSIAARGKLQGDDMLQLTSSGVPVLQLLAEQTGKTFEEISNMVSKGQIDFATFEAAMRAGMGGAALEMGNTFDGALKNMGAAMGRFGEVLVKPLYDSAPKLMGSVGKVFDSMGTALGPAQEKLTATLTPAFEQLAGVIETKIAPAAGEAAGKVGELVGRLAERAVDPVLWEQVWAAFTKIGDVAGDLWPTVSSLVESFGRVSASISVAVWEALAETLNALAPVVSAVVVPALEKLADTAEAHPGAVQALVTAFLGFKAVGAVAGPVGTAASSLKTVGEAVKFLGGAFKGASFAGGLVNVMAGFQSANPLIAGAAKAVASFTKGLVGFGKIASVVANGIRLIGVAIAANPIGAVAVAVAAVGVALWAFFTKTETGRQMWEKFTSALSAGWEAIKAAFSAGVQFVQEKFTAFMDGVRAVGDVFVGLKDRFLSSDIFAAVKAGFEEIKSFISTWVTQVGESFSTIGQVLATAWRTGLNIVKDIVATAWLVIVDLFTGNWSRIPETIGAGWKAIKDHFSSGVDAVKQLIIDWVTSSLERVSSMWENMKNLWSIGVEAVKGFVSSLVTSVTTFFKDLASKVISTVAAFIENVKAKFSEMVAKIISTVSELPGKIRAVFADAGSWLVNAGRDIMNGLWNGLKNKWNDVVGWLNGLKSRVTSAFSGATDAAERQINVSRQANGGIVQHFAHGGMSESHVAQIAPAGAWRVWAEPETGGEAYIPLAQSKRVRSTAILATVADKFGLTLTAPDGKPLSAASKRFVAPTGFAFADGGIVSPDELLRFFKGERVNGQQASRSLEGATYAYGGSNWGDCSSTQGQGALFAVGKPATNGRHMATMDAEQKLSAIGFKPGLGSGPRFAIGWFNGGPWNGHTSGTIDFGGGKTINVEMGGGRGNGQIGGGAAPANHPQYTDHKHLPLVSAVSAGVSDALASGEIASTSTSGVTTDDGLKIDWGEASNLASSWDAEQKRRARIRGLGLPFGIFDTGGVLNHGQLAMNLSGSPEVVINNNQLQAINKLANNVGALVNKLGSNLGAMGTAGVKKWLGLAKTAGFGPIVEYIEPTVNAFEKLQDSLIVQQDATAAVSQAEANLVKARESGDPAKIAKAEEDLTKARGVAVQAAKAAGFAQIELVLAIIQTIGKIFKKIWEGQVKAQVGVKNAIADSLKAVQEWGALVAQQRETVSKLQQQVVNDQIALTKSTWSVRLAQADLVRTQLEGVKSVAEAEKKLADERRREARKSRRDWNDLSLAYDRYRHAEMKGLADRLNMQVRITPEILALEHEVNAAKLTALAKQYKAALAALEASHAQQMAALNLAQSQLQLAQQSAQLAQMQQQYFGMSQDGALTGANTALLYAEKAKVEGRANRGLFGWIGSFFSDPIGTLKYAFGGGKKADAEYARFLDSEIARRTADGKGLSATMDAATEAQVKKLFAMGLDEQANNLIKASALGAPARAVAEAKEDQQVLAIKQQEQTLKQMNERLAALVEFEKKAQPLREQAAAFESGAASHQYSADALREENPAVQSAMRALAEFEAGRARDYAASARGEKTVLNLTVPVQDMYTKEQMDAVLATIGKIPDLELRLEKVEATPRPTATDLMSTVYR